MNFRYSNFIFLISSYFFCVQFPPSFGIYKLPENGPSVFVVSCSGQMTLVPIANILLNNYLNDDLQNLTANNLSVFNSINSDVPTNIGQSNNPITLYSGEEPVNIVADQTIIQNNIKIGGGIELDQAVKFKKGKNIKEDIKSDRIYSGENEELEDGFDGGKPKKNQSKVSAQTTLFRVDGATGNTTILGTIAVFGNSTFGGTLGVTGATILNGSLNAGSSILASSAITGNETVGGTLAVSGNSIFGGTLGVTGATTLNGALNAGASTFASSTITGNEKVGGTLEVAGDTSLSNLIVAKNLTVSGNLTTSGAFTPSSISLSGNFVVSGNTTLNATSINGGAVSINNGDSDNYSIVIGGKGAKNSSSITIQSNNSNIVLDANSNVKNATGNIVLANLQTTNNEAASYFLVCDSSGNVKRGSVFINVNNGIEISSKRYKEGIRDLKKISREAFKKLKIVLFKYKKEIDENQREQIGLIAEDVSKIDEIADLIVIKKNGDPESVDYKAVMMILLQQYLDSCEEIDSLKINQEKIFGFLEKIKNEIEAKN